MQSKDLGAPAAMAAGELQENDAGAHANAGYANRCRDWNAVVSLNAHGDMRQVRHQSA